MRNRIPSVFRGAADLSQVWTGLDASTEAAMRLTGVSFANTGGVTAGTEPLPTGGTTTALKTLGVAYDGTPNTNFAKIVTTLVLRNTMEVLRTKAVVMQESAYLRAKHVPGTKSFTYTAFADLGAAEDLLEGIPPQSEGLNWDTFEFTGGQKGKIVAITDLAELFSPFDLYSTAAEKIAWNIVDTAEKQAVTLLTGSNVGIGSRLVLNLGEITENIVSAVVGMKQAEIPPFADGNYHCLISPADAAAIMMSVGARGWTETMKYANGTALLNAEIGMFRGLRFIESNRIPDGKSVIYGPGSWIWGDYQTVQAYRVAPGGDHADPLAQRGLVGWKGMWGMALAAFDGSPAFGPASNPETFRFAQVNLAAIL
jgi:hypothetical protein